MAMSTQIVVMIKSCCCLLWLLSIVHSVSRENFKTCDQSGFCKRHRALKSGESPYVVVMDSLQIIDKHLQVELLNTENNVRLSLQLFGLEHNSARLKIDELKPTRSRYEIPMGDVLLDEPKQQQLKIIDKNQDTVTLSHSANRIVLSSKPFRLDVFNDGDHIMGLNAQGLLKFEHYRIKEGWVSGVFSWFSNTFREPPAEQKVEKPEDENNDAEQNAEEKKEEETAKEEEAGLWEESFKGFTDSKPYGPSSVGLDISFPGVENVYGIPEHAESLALKSTKDTDPYRLFNLDVFEYELYNPMALYGAVPVMLAHSEKRTLGIYWNNAAETWVDIRSTTADKTFFTKVADMVQGNADMPQTDTHWISESGVIDLFLMFGPTPRNVFKQYAVLTGTTPLPPLFAIAYHQSRWNYNDEVDVKNVDASFDKFDMPCDVIWLDIEHTDGKRYFTWDKDKFQHPVDMINNVASKGRKIVTIVDPHLKKDDNYQVYADAKSRNILVKNKDNGEYDGWCWPGSSAWPDFTDPAIRKWWAEKFHYNSYLGSSPDLFIWNDMNEPSVFNGPEITFHKDVKHANERENRDVHNIYGMYVHQATYEGIKLRSNNEQRPFVLSRAFFAGSQRFGAVWTGDNMGEWSHLKISNPMILSLNLVGITLSGADVGGFFRNPDSELLARWFQAGAYQPFFRAHAHLDTKRREPYLLPDNLRESTRNVIAARYSYLPFWYTLFYIGEKDGGPIMSPLWVDYPQDKSTFTIDDEYLIGSDLLVKPITEAGVTGTNVYFPGKNNIWYDVETYQTYQGASTTYVNAPMEKIPVYQRGGSIVPRKMRLRRSSGLMHNDPFTLIICLDKNREASGQLYVDDYSSHRYHQGEFIFRKFEFKNNKLTSSNAAHSSKYSTKEWLEKVVIVGYPQKPSSISIVSSSGMVSLSSSYDAASKSLVIRKPGNNIGEDFTINIQ